MRTLKPGTALFTGPRGPVLRDAAGELFSVALPDDALAAVRAALTTPDAPVPAELDAFARAGHLGERARWPAPRRVVAVISDHAKELAEVLAAAGAEPVVLEGFDAVAELAPAALCTWHDGPAPREWLEWEPAAPRGIAWQRTSREGRHVLLEPIDVPHRDVRARRLAAAGSGHEHLLAYWAQRDAVLGDEAPDAAEVLLVAALIAKDLFRWACSVPDTGPIPAARRLRVLELDTGTTTDHAVLPVPDSAP